MNITNVIVNERIRQDPGNLDELCNSIKEFGLIQPIVVYRNGSHKPEDAPVELCAGGRRLQALKRIGLKELTHGVHFIYRDEEDTYRRKAVELEENLKRKELTWQEQVQAKASLLQLMQQIHGVASSGGRTRAELADGSDGFGVRKLASMLNESVGQTSKDLQIASAIKSLPQLRSADTKESAFRQLTILSAMASMAKSAMAKPPAEQKWTLYEGDFRDNIHKIPDSAADLVYCDLPFGVALSNMSKHTGVVDYADARATIVGSLEAIAKESFRILASDRYAVFWFGFNYYGDLLAVLQRAGFNVNPVPVVWYKHTRSTENPNTRYGNAYDPAIVAMKGSAHFIRPGGSNVVDIPAVTSTERMQIAQQPVGLVKHFIEDMTAAGAHVVDLTAGSGTTGVAALELKRRVTLFEREASACALIRARLGAIK